MIKINLKYSAFFLLLVASPAMADLAGRDAIIQRELDCISGAQKNDPSFSWGTVCYNKKSTTVADDDENFQPVQDDKNENGNENLEPEQSGQDDDDIDRDVTPAETRPLLTGPQDIEPIKGEKPFDFNFNLTTGYRTDDLRFNIAGDVWGSNPNVLSELKWRQIGSWQIKGKGQMIFNTNIVLEASGDYAKIFKGKNQDSDYLSDNRANEFSRSNNMADTGYLHDLSAGLGYRFSMDDFFSNFALKEASFTPLFGFSHNAQHLRMTDGNQTYDPYNLIGLGPFAGLKSKYDTQWYGPWLGVEMKGKFKRFSCLARMEYHLNEYYAVADWNLRSDFKHPKSYEHRADGMGYFLGLEFGYELTKNWQINWGTDLYSYHTQTGIDRTYFSSGSTGETQLNKVEWSSASYTLGLKYSWL